MAEKQARKRACKPVYIGNERFDSLGDAALALGLKKATLYRRLKNGYTEEQLRSPVEHTTGQKRRTAKPVVINGISYNSIQTAAKHLGISYQTLHSRIKNGMETEKVIAKRKVNRKEIKLSYKGVNYPTIKAFCDAFGFPYSRTKYHITKGTPLDEIVAKFKQ